MKKIFQIIYKSAVLLLLLSVTSCYYDEVLPEVELPPVPGVSFTTDIQPIFTANCAGCHTASLAPDLRQGNAYAAIVNGTFIVPNSIDNSVLYQRLIGNGNLMPPSGPLTAAKLNLVKSWIEQGAKNN
ncbi:MAG TPA: hypothetical protein DER05_04605 [Lutibacter sp.]|nr:hypothetical protein [Lutibacter sp.]